MNDGPQQDDYTASRVLVLQTSVKCLKIRLGNAALAIEAHAIIIRAIWLSLYPSLYSKRKRLDHADMKVSDLAWLSFMIFRLCRILTIFFDLRDFIHAR